MRQLSVEAKIATAVAAAAAAATAATDLEGGHIEVIDEEEHLLAGGWAKQGLPLLLQLGLKHVLEVRGLGLRRVLHGVGHELVRVGGVLQVLLHDDTLPDSRVSHVEHVVPPAG